MEAITDERTARLAINALNLPGDERIFEEVWQHGAMEAVSRWQAGFGPTILCSRIDQAISDLPKIVEQQQRCSAEFLIPADTLWPQALTGLDTNAPIGLWVRGNFESVGDVNKCLSIVGARASTSYGDRIAAELGTMTADHDLATISGAAFGIDASAHRGALVASGLTVAVLACGVDVAYPSAHQGLLERIAENGAIVSEIPLGMPARKQHFLIRNRLIAALSAQTVVVEAALRSGALSTSNWANALGRKVWAVPGPITSASSAGANREIRLGNATLLADLDEPFASSAEF